MPGAIRISRKVTVSWATAPQAPIPDPYPMSQTEFQQLCRELGITNAITAAELFGLSARTCQRYHYGKLDVPGPLARLLRLTTSLNLGQDKLRRYAKPLTPKVTRQRRAPRV